MACQLPRKNDNQKVSKMSVRQISNMMTSYREQQFGVNVYQMAQCIMLMLCTSVKLKRTGKDSEFYLTIYIVVSLNNIR